jgi:hypothetical protein
VELEPGQRREVRFTVGRVELDFHDTGRLELCYSPRADHPAPRLDRNSSNRDDHMRVWDEAGTEAALRPGSFTHPHMVGMSGRSYMAMM